jgi:hypothetical protein
MNSSAGRKKVPTKQQQRPAKAVRSNAALEDFQVSQVPQSISATKTGLKWSNKKAETWSALKELEDYDRTLQQKLQKLELSFKKATTSSKKSANSSSKPVRIVSSTSPSTSSRVRYTPRSNRAKPHGTINDVRPRSTSPTRIQITKREPFSIRDTVINISDQYDDIKAIMSQRIDAMHASKSHNAHHQPRVAFLASSAISHNSSSTTSFSHPHNQKSPDISRMEHRKSPIQKSQHRPEPKPSAVLKRNVYTEMSFQKDFKDTPPLSKHEAVQTSFSLIETDVLQNDGLPTLPQPNLNVWTTTARQTSTTADTIDTPAEFPGIEDGMSRLLVLSDSTPAQIETRSAVGGLTPVVEQEDSPADKNVSTNTILPSTSTALKPPQPETAVKPASSAEAFPGLTIINNFSPPPPVTAKLSPGSSKKASKQKHQERFPLFLTKQICTSLTQKAQKVARREPEDLFEMENAVERYCLPKFIKLGLC